MEKEKKNIISWEFLKDFVKDLDVSSMELNPSEASLNEIASVGALLQIHAEVLYSRAKIVKAKAELDKDKEIFKQFQDGAFAKDMPKGKKVERIIASERFEKVNQEIGAGEEYALLMIVEPHKEEQADFKAESFWQQVVLNFLKERALSFIIGVLRGLIKDAIPAMVSFADGIINSMENRITDLYRMGTEEERRIFKENIKKYFPNSRLLEKL